MDGVVDQCADRLARRRDCLDDAHRRIVEFWSVVVVGNFSFSFASGDLQMSDLQMVEGLMDGGGGLMAGEVHELQVARCSAVWAGEAVAIRSAVCVGRPDQNVVSKYPRNLLMNAGAKDRGKPEQ